MAWVKTWWQSKFVPAQWDWITASLPLLLCYHWLSFLFFKKNLVCISYQECVWPNQWWRPAHGQQGHKGWWACAGLCQAAEGQALQITFLALPLEGETQWCWRNLRHKIDTKKNINMMNKYKLQCTFIDTPKYHLIVISSFYKLRQ